MKLINAEEFKRKLNNSKYAYNKELWDDICNMLSECTSYTPNAEEGNDKIHCPYYTTRMETRYLSDAEMCKVYALTGKVMRSAEQKIGYCMGTKDCEECHCNGLEKKCEHK